MMVLVIALPNAGGNPITTSLRSVPGFAVPSSLNERGGTCSSWRTVVLPFVCICCRTSRMTCFTIASEIFIFESLPIYMSSGLMAWGMFFNSSQRSPSRR